MPPITVPLHAPELAPGRWLQGPPVSMAFARGAVVLVDFWEATCIHCLRTLPYVIGWHRRYGPRGLVVVGVHTPEFELSADPGVVAAAVAAEGIPYPVLLDDGQATWRRFANKYWPAKYLVDPRGYLRFEHFGEGAYRETELAIQELLKEAGDQGAMPEPLSPLRPEDRPGAVCHPASRELHLGYHRGRLLAEEGYRPEEEVLHRWPADRPVPPGRAVARGLWRHGAEFLEVREAGAELEVAADAAGVSLVLATEGEVEVELDGAAVPRAARGADLTERDGATWARWDRPRPVELLAAERFGRWRLRLRFHHPGARAYVFAFTTCVDASPRGGRDG